MKGGKVLAYAAVTILAISIITSFASDSGITSYATVQGGSVTGAGGSNKANPNYGAVTGYVLWTIVDGSGNTISSERPIVTAPVYFVSSGQLVNWAAPITCSTQLTGTLSNLDADSTGSQCISTNYNSPTAYECSATLTSGSPTLIYQTYTSLYSGNEGCFAAKIPAGSYDMYV